MQRLSAARAPELSVLLPYRDAESTLPEALDSVLSQRNCELELIAIDDGSRDGSSRVVAEHAARDQRIVAMSTEGIGIPRALNLGLSAARAALIARMDADDVSLPGRFESQLQMLRARPELAVLGTRVEAFPAEQAAEGIQRYVAWQNGLLDALEHRAQLFVESPLCHPSVVMRTDALRAIDGYRDGPFPEDYDLWLRFDRAGYAMAKLPEVLLRWRQSPSCATRTDPRYARASFTSLKAPHLAARIQARPRTIDVWGAGQTGRRLARALEPHGLRAARFLDIDPRKLGGVARSAPIEPFTALAAPGERWVVVALGARGARDQARAYLQARGHVEGEHFLCAS